MKTLTVEEFHKAIAFVATAIQNADEWNATYPQYNGFVGWLDQPLTPRNRAAFVREYGEEVTAQVQAAAEKVLLNEKTRDENSQYAAHRAAARANADKPTADLVIGDYVMCCDPGMKFDHEDLEHNIKDAIEFGDPRLVRIIRIEDRPAGFFATDNLRTCLRDWKPMENEGGCQNDDYDTMPDDKKELQRYYDTFYTLAVLVRDPSGRCVFIDPEGYHYPRYCLLRDNWRDMFAETYEKVKGELADEGKGVN